MKDAALVESASDLMVALLLDVFALKPELRLKALGALAPEERLAGLAPEERLAGVDPAHQILALSDEVLRGFAPEYLDALPDDVRAKVLARIGRSPAR